MKKSATTSLAETGFDFRNGILHAGPVSLADLAQRFGTPCYVYSRDAILAAYRRYEEAFGDRPHLVCYAVKANPSREVLETLAGAGAGFDIVSGGELARVIAAGGDPARIVFSGVGKHDDELVAGLEAGIRSFNVESLSELRRLDRLAQRAGRRARVALRVNPDVPADTHPHIATGGREHKFGLGIEQIPGLAALAQAMNGIELAGLAMHIGSQITDLQPLVEAATRLRDLAGEMQRAGLKLREIDLGGGLGVGPGAPSASDYVTALTGVFADGTWPLVIEPGRSIVADAGLLLTRVLCIKHAHSKSFAIVDAAMNDLLRPALYGAHHEVVNVETGRLPPTSTYDIVGPVCETADTLAKQRTIAIREGSLLAFLQAGAYGAAMASNYNSRPLCPEIFVGGEEIRLGRKREAVAELH